MSGGGAASAETIKLEDGEAAFAQLREGTDTPNDGDQLAEYVGLETGTTSKVVFYIQSDALGTTVTASTTGALGGSPLLISGQTVTLVGGSVYPSRVVEVDARSDGTPDDSITFTVPGAPANNVSKLVEALTDAYCRKLDTTVVEYTNATGYSQPSAATTTISVSGFGVRDANGTNGTSNGNCGSALDIHVRPVTERAVLTEAQQTEFAEKALHALNVAEVPNAINQNHAKYTYKDGSKWLTYDKVNPARRYTHGEQVGGKDGATFVNDTDFNRDIVGGSTRPLLPAREGISSTRVMTDANTSANDKLFAFTSNATGNSAASNPTGGSFHVIVPTDLNATNVLDVQATYDIVDVYEDEDIASTTTPYPDYTSGYGRAYVSSGSDSGQWVTIGEVAAVGGPVVFDPNSNLFRGVVEITNDPGAATGVYVQHGDTLTLQVFDENADRSSDVLAEASVTIDNSPPTISDLNPADESVINDNALLISFNVNDEGAGVDFRQAGEKKVVTAVYAQARDESATTTHKGAGKKCRLDTGADDITNGGGNAGSVRILLSPSDIDYTDRCGSVVDVANDGKFNLIIASRDMAGNTAEHTSRLTIDTQKPVVMGNPEAGNGWNEDKNKRASSRSSVLIEFSEALDPDTVAASDFTVAGYTVDSAQVVGANDDDKSKPQNLDRFVVLTLTEELAKNARPSVTVADEGVSDVAGNAIEKATRTSNNVIKAALSVAPFGTLVGDEGEQAISFTADEALRSRSGDNETKASVNGAKLAVKVADDTMGGSATFKETTFGDSRAYGVMIQAVDMNGNVTRAGAVKVDDDDVKLALDDEKTAGEMFSVKLANWPPADSNLNGKFAGEVVAKVNNEEVASSTDTVHWDGADAGKVQLLVGAGVTIKKDATLTLSYSYVTADQVIQVDVDAPTLTSVPKDNSETDYAATAIQFKWAEGGEYAGDTYKTVTLNSATHVGPSGTSTDITDALTTNDNIRWVFRPSAELPLGDHEFTLKATDAAGNEAEETINFKVVERKPVEIGLSPGWNLISFRGAPASLDADDIFGADSGISVVSQYDGRKVSPWTVWTRGADGSLSSSPAGVANIDPGLGIYVLSTDGTTLEVDIPGTSKDNPAELPPSIDLIAGWNLIAVVILDNDADRVFVDDYLPAGVWSRAFKLDNDTGRLSSMSPKAKGADSVTTVNAGQALWVFATEAGVVTPSQ